MNKYVAFAHAINKPNQELAVANNLPIRLGGRVFSILKFSNLF